MEMFLSLFVVLAMKVAAVLAEETGACYTSGDIAGSVLGTFFSTLAAVAVAFIIYWFVCRPKRGKSSYLRPKNGDIEAHAYDNPYFQDEDQEKAITIAETKTENGSANPEGGKSPTNKNKVSNDGKAGKKNRSSKNNPFTNVFTNNKSHTIQRALDDSCIQQEPEKIEVRLRGCDFTGLGFNICGNIRHGIYVRDVLHRGPASESGKIKAGDRILGVTVCFDKITIEDALTILSYASPYDVTLFMQKTSEQLQPGAAFLPGHQKRGSTASSISGSGLGTGGAELLSHPVYRSQSSDDVSQLAREANSNKRSLSVGVVGPRVKAGSGGIMHRVEPISEGEVTLHEKNRKETVVAVVVNEAQKASANTNPFADGERKQSIQIATAVISPKDLTIEIPTFGLTEVTAGSEKKIEEVSSSHTEEEKGSSKGSQVVGPCIEPKDSMEESDVVDSVHNLNGGTSPSVDIPDMRRTFIRELTSTEDSLKNFDIPAMDLDDIHVSLDEKMKQVNQEAEQLKTDIPSSEATPDLSTIKQTFVKRLSQENLLADESEKTIILPRVDLKTPSVADFEVDPIQNNDSLDENINYFESKMQKVLQNSPKVKPKRNSIPGKRKAPPPPAGASQPSSPTTENAPYSDPNVNNGNPFVKGILSQASIPSLEKNGTTVVFLKPNNVTSVQVNSESTSPEPKSPKRNRPDVGLGLGSIVKTNFHEGLDKASGEERFNSIPRTSSNDKSSSSRRAASLDDLTKIEEAKPLPLERAVSMDLNNTDELAVVDLDADCDKSSEERLIGVYFTKVSDQTSKEKIENLDDWIKTNVDKQKLTEYLEKGAKRNDVSSDPTFIAIPLERTSSGSTSTLSEDSIENEKVPIRRHMSPIDPTLKTYLSDSESEEEIRPSSTNLRPSSALSPSRSPLTIPVIPPIINTRERTPSPSKEKHGNDLKSHLTSIKVQHEENGEYNGSTSSGYDRHQMNNDHVTVTTMHVTVNNEGKGEAVDAYSVGEVVAKTVYISGPQLVMPVVDSGPESPPPILQPPE